MQQYNFGPACQGELFVFGAEKPIRDAGAIHQWVDFMQRNGIQRVCCLLSEIELYRGQLSIYAERFGEGNVCHAPIQDLHLCERELLHDSILPFLQASIEMHSPVVVHCWGGNGRTGHILAAWLVHSRGFLPEEAIYTICQMGRNPKEAIEQGNATDRDLLDLLDSCQPIQH